jgi:hypothetical protein
MSISAQSSTKPDGLGSDNRPLSTAAQRIVGKDTLARSQPRRQLSEA